MNTIRAGKTNQTWWETHKGGASRLTHEGTGFPPDNKQKLN